MAFCYRVETVCAATIREVWMIRSPRALPADAIAAALEARGPNVIPLEDETRVTEADRTVREVLRLNEKSCEH